MIFTRFQSLLNENPKNSLPVLEEFANADAIKTEKIHGANFSVYVGRDKDGVSIRYASRNNYLCRDSNFSNFQRYFTKEKEQDIINREAGLIEFGDTIRLVGELFGGHDAVGVKPVQREIRYDGDIQFRVFHAEVIDEDGVVHPFEWTNIPFLTKELGLEIVPVISQGPLSELYQEGVEVPSTLASNGDIAEGFCYRLRENVHGEAIILKRRTTKFSETKGKVGGKLVEREFDPAIRTLLDQVRSMVTPQRVSNVNSHHGFIGMACFKDLHIAVMEDIQKDALSDFGIDDAAFKVVRKEVGYLINPLLKQELTK